MEQRKALLVIASVTLVLAAFLGFGIWMLSPNRGPAAPTEDTGSAISGIEWEPMDFLRGDDEMPRLERTEEPAEFEVTYGVADSADGAPASRGEPVAELMGDSAETTESDSPEATTSTTALSGADSDIVITTRPQTRRAPSYDKEEAPVVAAPANARPTARSTEVASAAPTSRAQVVPQTQSGGYWIQLISSPSRDTVEQAQRDLSSHQLGTTITTKQLDETVYYRLRLGPFGVREEAEKFLAWIHEIDGYESAMIFLDYRTRVAAGG